jgi:hypothetical protein
MTGPPERNSPAPARTGDRAEHLSETDGLKNTGFPAAVQVCPRCPRFSVRPLLDPRKRFGLTRRGLALVSGSPRLCCWCRP